MAYRRQPQPLRALRKAEDLRAVGEPKAALKTVTAFMADKRRRGMWMIGHETLMLKLIEWTLELRDAMAMKDALFHYSEVAKSTPRSFKKVIEHAITLIETRCEAQRQLAADEADGEAVDHVDEAVDPETFMLGVASVDSARSARAELVPMLAHACNAINHAVNTLQRVPALSDTYHSVAARCLRFLRSFRRAKSFKWVCRSIERKLNRDEELADAAGGFSRDELSMQLATRFEMLAGSASLSLWMVAFDTARSIDSTISKAAHAPDEELLAGFYDRLGAVFWASGSTLLHAYARLRRSRVASPSDADSTDLADRVVLAALCVPRFASESGGGADAFGGDAGRESKAQLAALLSFTSTPTREGLVASIRSTGVLDAASAPARDLFETMETKFAPLDLSGRCAAAMGRIFAAEEDGAAPAAGGSASAAAAAATATDVLSGGEAPLSMYRRRICEEAALRQTHQLSRTYSTITVDTLFGMLEPLGLPRTDAEQVVVSAVRARALDLRIDHRAGHVVFAWSDLHGGALRSHLATLTTRLRDAVARAAASDPGAAPAAEVRDAARREDVFRSAREAADGVAATNSGRAKAVVAYRAAVSLARKTKEMQARILVEQEKQREKEELARREEKARMDRERAEKKRLEEVQYRKEVMERVAALKAMGEDIDFDPDQDDAKQAIARLEHLKAQAIKNRERELQRLQKERLRRLDYFCRAVSKAQARKADSADGAASLHETLTKFADRERSLVKTHDRRRHDRAMEVMGHIKTAGPVWGQLQSWAMKRDEVRWASSMDAVLRKAGEKRRVHLEHVKAVEAKQEAQRAKKRAEEAAARELESQKQERDEFYRGYTDGPRGEREMDGPSKADDDDAWRSARGGPPMARGGPPTGGASGRWAQAGAGMPMSSAADGASRWRGAAAAAPGPRTAGPAAGTSGKYVPPGQRGGGAPRGPTRGFGQGGPRLGTGNFRRAMD